MTPLGLPSFDRLSVLPADLVEALRLIPKIAENTALLRKVARALERVAGNTEVLPGVREDMALVAEATSVLGAMDDRMAAIEEAMPVLVEVQRHLAQLPETMGGLDDGLDRLSGLMERLMTALDELNQSVDGLHGAVAPMGRLAGRVQTRQPVAGSASRRYGTDRSHRARDGPKEVKCDRSVAGRGRISSWIALTRLRPWAPPCASAAASSG